MTAAERDSRATRSAIEAGMLEGVADVSAAVQTGAGLPEVTRAAARALSASVVVIDTAGSVLAVACRSPEDERAVLAGQGATNVVELRVGDGAVGELRLRANAEPAPDALMRMVTTLLAVETDRAQAPTRESDAAAADLIADLIERRTTDRRDIVARADELGADLKGGAAVLVLRARPQHPESGDWRGRVLTLAERGARPVSRGALVARVTTTIGRVEGDGASDDELVVLLPGVDEVRIERAARSVLRELEAGLSGYTLTVATSRPALDPVDIHRAAAEALLAVNVAEAQGDTLLAFERTGAYRLLLSAMSDDPGELQRFYDETVAPLVAYDEEYETELLRTLETFLDADGSIANTAEKLYTHRHTIRYRLERVRDLSGFDVSSTDGRERLSLGLKAMRVLGISPARGPATEPGVRGGRVGRKRE